MSFGPVIGLVFGLGVVLIVWTFVKGPSQPTAKKGPSFNERTQELLLQAGLEQIKPSHLIISAAGLGVVVFMLMVVVSGAIPIAIIFGGMGAYLPILMVKHRARTRRKELRELWPDVVDNLASSVRAGLSLAEALSQIGVRGPETLRPPFQRFGEDYRATGRFNDCLDRLKWVLADPVGDRIVESLRIAREVGGSDLGRLLRTLSAFLREDVRTRAEIEAKQSWTVNGARLAVAAPWMILGAMAFQGDIVKVYNSWSGVLVLAIGAGACLLAYRLMVRIGRLPEEDRVLR